MVIKVCQNALVFKECLERLIILLLVSAQGEYDPVGHQLDQVRMRATGHFAFEVDIVKLFVSFYVLGSRRLYAEAVEEVSSLERIIARNQVMQDFAPFVETEAVVVLKVQLLGDAY